MPKDEKTKKGQRVLVHDPSKKGPKLPRPLTAKERRIFESANPDAGFARTNFKTAHGRVTREEAARRVKGKKQ